MTADIGWVKVNIFDIPKLFSKNSIFTDYIYLY